MWGYRGKQKNRENVLCLKICTLDVVSAIVKWTLCKTTLGKVYIVNVWDLRNGM